MAATQKRQFHEGEKVYLVDCWGTSSGPQAFGNSAIVSTVEEDSLTLKLLDTGKSETLQKYSINDYGRLIFDTLTEADTAAKELPKPNSIIYQEKMDNQYVVRGIWYKVVDGIVKLVIKLEDGEDILTDRIGVDIFLSN